MRGLFFVWEVAACCRNMWLGSQDGLFKARGPLSPEIQRSGCRRDACREDSSTKGRSWPLLWDRYHRGATGGLKISGLNFLPLFRGLQTTKINPFDWLCHLILKISSEHLPVFSTAYQAKSQHQIMSFVITDLSSLPFLPAHLVAQVLLLPPLSKCLGLLRI